MSRDLFLTGNDAADRLLGSNADALLLGMVLDQQVPMEKAFTGPAVIAERMGGRLDVAAIAAMDTDQFVSLCSTPPAIHRFPGSMAKRVQQVCRVLAEEYAGSAAHLWDDAGSGKELVARVKALPGFGAQKAQIFVALLGKQWGVTPTGWEAAAGDYGSPGHRSVADVTDPESLQAVRAYKKEAKRAAREAAADKES